MNARTHLLFGMLFGVLYLHFYPIPSLIMKIIFAICLTSSALLPDIDLETSTVGRKHRWIANMSVHRGTWHSIFIPIGFYGLAIFFPTFEIPLMGLFVGYVSHLIGDMITKEGIKPLAPLYSKWRVKGFMKSGGFTETIIAVFIVVYFLIK